MPSKWRKSPPELVDCFTRVVPRDPRVEPRQMFGYPCAFCAGNMFMGLHQESFILRLRDEHRAEFLQREGAAIFEPMPGRQMREYVVVPPALLGNPEELGLWIARALAYAVSLPAKAARARKKAPAGGRSARTKRS